MSRDLARGLTALNIIVGPTDGALLTYAPVAVVATSWVAISATP